MTESPKTMKQLIEEKLSNFKYLIASKIVYDDNENFVKLMEYDADKIIEFYLENVQPYLSFGHGTIIRSFLSHLEIPTDDEELNVKLEKYFEFFKDAVKQLQQTEIDGLDVNQIPK